MNPDNPSNSSEINVMSSTEQKQNAFAKAKAMVTKLFADMAPRPNTGQLDTSVNQGTADADATLDGGNAHLNALDAQFPGIKAAVETSPATTPTEDHTA